MSSSRQISHWIDGKAVPGSSGRQGPVFNPATGRQAGSVAMANGADVDTALSAASAAFPEWAATPALGRARVMFRFKELIDQHRQEITGLITAEHGKVLSDADGSLQRGLEVVEFACGIPHLLKGEFSSDIGRGVDCHSVREPLGVCVGISPFNFPAMVPMWMFPLAIACGNTFVMKPSEKTPSCAVRLAELLQEAGLPPGVFNVIHGDKEAVDALLTDQRVAAVSFVGSTPVAESIYRQAAERGIRAQSLGGAKNHMVVLPDADMEQAADALIGAAYGSAGERCMAISVAVAVGDAGDGLRDALLPRIAAIKVRPGDQPDADMGPLITREHLEKVASYIQAGKDEGADLVVDGRDLEHSSWQGGFFLGPTLFDHATPDMSIYRDEIFGPVLTMLRAANLGDALGIVNGHEYANGAAVFTRSGKAARDFATRVDAGMVGVNIPIPVPMAFYSFGGHKRSIFGDSNVQGAEGVRFYTRTKTITSRWPEGLPGQGGSLDMPTLGD
ncbi:MAG: CoA-acylating methylmalonate-semialdehyde dehydrogenase [Chromatiales bacterium]|nr:MAG: CoA-acylating methylmalonate-semialdehyde dehydrogenase [Chromatiales bacterium]